MSFLIYFALLFILFHNSYQDSYNEIRYPKSISLPKGQYFIIYNRGINTSNSDFSFNNSIYNFSNDEIIGDDDDSEDFIKKTRIAKYIDDEVFYILCLIKGTYIFIFDYNNNYFYKNETMKITIEGCDFNIIPLKKENNYFNFIVTFLKNNGVSEINFYHYNIELSFNQLKNFNLSTNKYENSSIQKDYTNCQKMSMKSFNNNKVLVCFYLYSISFSNYFLIAKIFNISNNFEYINESSFNLANADIIDIKSSISKDEKKSLVCFKYNLNQSFNCLSYDIDENKFNLINITTKKCDSFETYYFNETNQYVLIVKEKSSISFEIIILNHEFKILKIESNINNFKSLCENIIGFTLVYSSVDQQYNILTDCEKS